MSIMSKLTKKTVKITVTEETKLSQILYWIFFLVCLTIVLLKLFLDVPGYATIVWIVCCVAYVLSTRKHSSGGSTSPLDFNQTLDAINKSVKNTNN